MLFGIVPPLSVTVLTIVTVIRLVRDDRAVARKVASVASRRSTRFARVFVTALLIGHVFMLAWPQLLLRWAGDLPRLLVLETLYGGVGIVATMAVGVALALRLPMAKWSAGDVACLGVLTVTMTSGLGIAIFHRWALAWSSVVLTPYVQSLVTLQPQADGLVALPYLVRLHVFSSFLTLAVLPFSTFFERARRTLDSVAIAALPIVATLDRQSGLLLRRAIRSGQSLLWPEEAED